MDDKDKFLEDWAATFSRIPVANDCTRVDSAFVDLGPAQGWSTVQGYDTSSEKEPKHNNRKPYRFNYEL